MSASPKRELPAVGVPVEPPAQRIRVAEVEGADAPLPEGATTRRKRKAVVLDDWLGKHTEELLTEVTKNKEWMYENHHSISHDAWSGHSKSREERVLIKALRRREERQIGRLLKLMADRTPVPGDVLPQEDVSDERGWAMVSVDDTTWNGDWLYSVHYLSTPPDEGAYQCGIAGFVGKLLECDELAVGHMLNARLLDFETPIIEWDHGCDYRHQELVPYSLLAIAAFGEYASASSVRFLLRKGASPSSILGLETRYGEYYMKSHPRFLRGHDAFVKCWQERRFNGRKLLASILNEFLRVGVWWHLAKRLADVDRTERCAATERCVARCRWHRATRLVLLLGQALGASWRRACDRVYAPSSEFVQRRAATWQVTGLIGA